MNTLLFIELDVVMPSETGGIVVYFRTEFSSFVTLERFTEYSVLWIRIAKEGISAEADLLLCTCYVLPAGSRRQNVSCNVFDQVFDDLIELENKYKGSVILIAGDLNARPSEQADFVVLRDDEADYLDLPEGIELENVNVVNRVSKDKMVINENGANLLNFCKYTGYGILNGRTGK